MAVLHVRHRGDVRRLLHLQAQRACSGRDFLFVPVRARPALARSDRHAVLPDPVLFAARLSVLAVLHAGLRRRRSVGQRRRPDPLADQIRGAGRLRDAGIAGRLGGDQAHRGAAEPRDDRCEIREADAMITLEMMPPIMFGGLVLAMLIGFPVAFTLAAVGLSFGFLAIHLGFFDLNFLQAIPGRVFGSVLSNELLLAIPFFTFMGAILARCGLAEEMLDSMGQLFGPIRGGLGYSVIIVGFILGAITGTVAAQVIAMALIALPVMMRYKYNMKYATGVLAASGTITQLVPPSLVLVVLADQLGKSVGDMYLGAWGPSIIQVMLFLLFTFLVSVFKPGWVPAVPAEDRTLKGWALWKKCLWGIIPAAVLIFLVLGTLLMGLATPTEGGAMGAVGAIVLAALRHPQ